MTQKSKNAYRELLIKDAIKRGYSLNKTQKLLISRHLGIKRQNLQIRFRILKKTEKKQDVSKYIPRKYIKKGFAQKQWIKRAEKEKEKKLYRVSLAIKGVNGIGVPLHSSLTKPIYYGFLMQAWSFNSEYLRGKIHGLKTEMFKLMKKHLISNAYVDDLRGEIHIENPVEIVSNPNFNNVWRYKVERNGTVIDDAEGNLEQL